MRISAPVWKMKDGTPTKGTPAGTNAARKQARRTELFIKADLADRIDRFAARARFSRTVAFERMGELALRL
ncbi:MAG: hypothetical protein FJW39_30855 [Acidobacteria bacterium]|nr:hypothetical protein [Acidobacteriota bacterium]